MATISFRFLRASRARATSSPGHGDGENYPRVCLANLRAVPAPARRLRPALRRRLMMARPFFVAMRAKNPNWRTRRFWEGCNVLFIGGPQIREGKHTGRAMDDKRKLW